MLIGNTFYYHVRHGSLRRANGFDRDSRAPIAANEIAYPNEIAVWTPRNGEGDCVIRVGANLRRAGWTEARVRSLV